MTCVFSCNCIDIGTVIAYKIVIKLINRKWANICYYDLIDSYAEHKTKLNHLIINVFTVIYIILMFKKTMNYNINLNRVIKLTKLCDEG